jgi:hypothetical protein
MDFCGILNCNIFTVVPSIINSYPKMCCSTPYSKCRLQQPSRFFNRVKIKIAYRTTPQCTALQWLDKNQTASKTHPYMFSQCQAIHCRSMVPCQDTPSVKAPYTAEVSDVSKWHLHNAAVACDNNGAKCF